MEIFELNWANNTFQVRKESSVIMTFILGGRPPIWCPTGV